MIVLLWFIAIALVTLAIGVPYALQSIYHENQKTNAELERINERLSIMNGHANVTGREVAQTVKDSLSAKQTFEETVSRLADGKGS